MIDKLVATMRQVALCRPLLIAVDGLPHYRKAIRRAFRSPLPQCANGRPRLIAWSDILIGRHQTQAERCIDRRTPPTGNRPPTCYRTDSAITGCYRCYQHGLH